MENKETEIPHKFNRNSCIIFMGGKWSICGYEFNGQNSDVFSFHHLDPENKQFELKNDQIKRRRTTTVLKELEKCILLCENCHRLVHDKKITIDE